MRMYSLNKRDRFYSQADLNDAVCMYRSPVIPGQSFALDGRIKMQSEALTANKLSNMIADVYFFYVPNRLVWDEWPEFIARSETGSPPANVPVVNGWPELFEGDGTRQVSALARRAFKLSYNQYLGGQGTFNRYDVTQDAVNIFFAMHNPEQLSRVVQDEDDFERPQFSLSGESPDQTVDLWGLATAMGNLRSKARAQTTGDKYVDSLRRMGVEPDWRIQNAPEFIGKGSTDLRPIKTFSTADTEIEGSKLGVSVVRYEGTVDVKTKRVMTAEHGYVIGIGGVRPVVYPENQLAVLDAYDTTVTRFWLGDNEQIMRGWPDGAIVDAGEGTTWTPQYTSVTTGQHRWGAGNSWINRAEMNITETYRYPLTQIPTQDEISSGDYAFETQIKMRGQTPASKVIMVNT